MTELLNPRITITNMEDGFWLVGFRHEFDHQQVLDMTVKITKLPKASVLEVAQAAIARMDEMLPGLYRQTG